MAATDQAAMMPDRKEDRLVSNQSRLFAINIERRFVDDSKLGRFYLPFLLIFKRRQNYLFTVKVTVI